MKYSMNYYSKRNRDFKDTYLQIPKVFETKTTRELKQVTEENFVEEKSRNQFVVPWQLP